MILGLPKFATMCNHAWVARASRSIKEAIGNQRSYNYRLPFRLLLAPLIAVIMMAAFAFLGLVAPVLGDTANTDMRTADWLKPFKAWQETHEIPPPAPVGRTSEYSLAKFYGPFNHKAGIVKIEVFIKARTAGFGPFFRDWGNDRDFNPAFTDIKTTKATIVLDMQSGFGKVVVSPTCWYDVIEIRINRCHAAHPISGDRGASNMFRYRSPEGAGMHPDSQFFEIQYQFKNASINFLPGRKIVPAIEGQIEFVINPDGSICVTGGIDHYPSTGIYRDRWVGTKENGRVVHDIIFQHSESPDGPRSLSAPSKARVDGCIPAA